MVFHEKINLRECGFVQNTISAKKRGGVFHHLNSSVQGPRERVGLDNLQGRCGGQHQENTGREENPFSAGLQRGKTRKKAGKG